MESNLKIMSCLRSQAALDGIKTRPIKLLVFVNPGCGLYTGVKFMACIVYTGVKMSAVGSIFLSF